MAEVFICPEPGSGPGERFYLDVLPATTLQATNNVIEGGVISTHTLDDDGCNAVLLCVHLDGAGASNEMYIVILNTGTACSCFHAGNDLSECYPANGQR